MKTKKTMSVCAIAAMLLACSVGSQSKPADISDVSNNNSTSSSHFRNVVEADSTGQVQSQRIFEVMGGRVLSATRVDAQGGIHDETASWQFDTPPSCPSGDNWVFDGTGETGNEMCVTITGGSSGNTLSLDLTTTLRYWYRCGLYSWCAGYWADSTNGGYVRSFYSGDDTGMWWVGSYGPKPAYGDGCAWYNGDSNYETFGSDYYESPAGTYAAAATCLNQTVP
jgi:hypothetical protein